MTVIEVKNISKKFKLASAKYQTLKEKYLFRNESKYHDFWALRDISLSVEKGKTVGLIGENGSGKSTLLKLISRIIYPTSGTITVRGRVSSLIELGAGFHPDFTGRENIYSNAAIFGMSKNEIDSKMDKIISFSELGEFIDSPIRTYSSGMYMRLAFSVAVSVDPELLLIDEILAVGDANFQRKCFEHLSVLKSKGVTIVIVTHDASIVQRFCDEAYWICDGLIKASGGAVSVVDEYLKFMSDKYDEKLSIQEESKSMDLPLVQKTDDDIFGGQQDKSIRYGNKKIIIKNIQLFDKDNKNTFTIQSGENLNISFDYEVKEMVDSLVFGIAIKRLDGFLVYGTNTFLDGMSVETKAFKSKGTIEFQFEQLNLTNGTYSIDVAASSSMYENYDYWISAIKLNIKNDSKESGICSIKHKWVSE